MKKILDGIASGLLILIIGSSFTHAAIIYENASGVNNAVFSDPHIGQFIADDFSLSPGRNTITNINWTGIYTEDVPPAPDEFKIQLFADVGGVPAVTPLLSLIISKLSRIDTGIDIFFDDLFAYSATVSPITLPPDTTFWLSIVNAEPAALFSDWAWGSQLLGDLASDDIAGRYREDVPWFISSHFIQDFTISGPVSVAEPAAIVLLAIGLLVLYARWWNRARTERARTV